MIDYMKGKIKYFDGEKIIIENENAGNAFILINVNQIPIKLENEIIIYICSLTNDFEASDYGFLVKEQRDMFADLIKIKTVGPKTAIIILEVFGFEQFRNVIETNDIDQILEIKGIGTFTARLIINELSKKYFDFKLNQKQEKIINSLMKLGFKSKDIYLALKDIKKETDLEEMTKLILERIAKNESARI